MLPGGFVKKTESIGDAARRILVNRTGVANIYLEQFKVFGNATRSQGSAMADLVKERSELLGTDIEYFRWLTERFVSIGYYALVDMSAVVARQSQFDTEINWFPLPELPDLFMDHEDIVLGALAALRLSLDRKLIGFNLLPKEFTMRELQELYEAVYDKKYVRANFQKRMLRLDILERLGKKFTGASNKAPYLYRFKE